jgi:hypothetical protein
VTGVAVRMCGTPSPRSATERSAAGDAFLGRTAAVRCSEWRYGAQMVLRIMGEMVPPFGPTSAFLSRSQIGLPGPWWGRPCSSARMRSGRVQQIRARRACKVDGEGLRIEPLPTRDHGQGGAGSTIKFRDIVLPSGFIPLHRYRSTLVWSAPTRAGPVALPLAPRVATTTSAPHSAEEADVPIYSGGR